MHYNRMLRNGDPSIRTLRATIELCTVIGCGKPHDARGLCSAHVTSLRRHGSAIAPRARGRIVDGNKICRDCAEDLPLSEFYPVAKSWNSRCKPCLAIQRKAYRDSRPDIVRAQSRASAAKRPLQRRDAARKRRATLREVTVEDVESMAVYDRDGWACGICEIGIPRVTVWPHPLSPSLDHITAISRGGHHSYSNTQAAHLACNMSKGARIPA